MLNKYKELCETLQISFKKDFIITLSLLIIFLVSGGILLALFQSIIGFFMLIMGICYLFFHFTSLLSNKKQLIDSKEIAFNGFYRYIVSSLENGEILYAALKKSLEYADNILQMDIENFIFEIENDTSLQPFINFSHVFNDENIKQMIIMLYQTQESETTNLVLERINNCLINLQDSAINSYARKEENKIEKYFIIPLVLSAIVIVVVSFFIFSLIGDGIYV